jgi:hypothetical protein
VVCLKGEDETRIILMGLETAFWGVRRNNEVQGDAVLVSALWCGNLL